MIKLSNGMEFKSIEALQEFIGEMVIFRFDLAQAFRRLNNINAGSGIRHAISTAIAAIDASIENAELALKSAQQRKAKMKAAVKKKPAAKPVAKKPATKKPTAKKK